jgi:hypothetical protein
MSGAPDTVKAKLTDFLPESWEKIPEKHFKALLLAIPDHVQVVIDEKGWHTRY